MQRQTKKKAAPERISEEYYQISPEILTSFPKFRLPLPLFRYREEVGQLLPIVQKGERISTEQQEHIRELCEEGDLFVSRADYPIYSKHICKQLDLILVDKNLKDAEIASICIQALSMRMGDFIEQPVKPVFELLYRDLMTFGEYIWIDKYRLKTFMRRINRKHTLINHSINSLFIGLWLLTANQASGEMQLKRKEYDRTITALAFHDIGMSKIPAFILSKSIPLKPEEKEKIPPHTLVGAKIAQKMDLGWDELVQATMEHHERLDGSGYPRRIRDTEISKIGRLTALADSFSAMICERAYAPAKDPAEAATELVNAPHLYDNKLALILRNSIVSKAFGSIPEVGAQPDDLAPKEEKNTVHGPQTHTS